MPRHTAQRLCTRTPVHTAHVQKLLQHRKLSAFEHLYFVCPVAASFQLLIVLLAEPNAIYSLQARQHFRA